MCRFGFTIMLKIPARYQRAVTNRYRTQFSFEIYGPSEMDAPPKDQQTIQGEVTSGIAFDHQGIGTISMLIRQANDGTFPVIRLPDQHTDRTNALVVEGDAGSHFTLDGLLIFGRGIHLRRAIDLEGELCAVTIRHCTLVPGWDLEHDCEPKAAHAVSLLLPDTDAHVTIEHSILGA